MTTYSETELDNAARYRDTLEERGAAATQSKSTTLAIVTIVGGEKVTMVTQCKPRERGDWLDHLGRDTAEDIDARWGMAWVDAQGTIQHAGTDLMFAIEAIGMVQNQEFSDDGLTAVNEPDGDTPFAIVGENDEGTVREIVPVKPDERELAMELYGFDTSSTYPWAIAWQPKQAAGIMTTGNDVGSACRAVLDLVHAN